MLNALWEESRSIDARKNGYGLFNNMSACVWVFVQKSFIYLFWHYSVGLTSTIPPLFPLSCLSFLHFAVVRFGVWLVNSSVFFELLSIHNAVHLADLLVRMLPLPIPSHSHPFISLLMTFLSIQREHLFSIICT